MNWPDDPTAVQADASESPRKLAGEILRLELYLVGLFAVFLAVIGAVVYVVFFQSSGPDTRVLRVDVAALTAQAEAGLRYPGATVLSHKDAAGVSTLTAHYTVTGGGSRGSPITVTLQGYSGAAIPATATQLLTVHADPARVDAWYRGVLLSHGWCVAQHDPVVLPGTRLSVTEVFYLRGHEGYQLDFGNSRLVRYLQESDQPGATETDLSMALLGDQAPSGFPTDPTKVEQFIQSLADAPNAPLTVYTSYELYPDGSIPSDGACVP